MVIFRLTDDLVFPLPELADDDGLLAVGGDLTVERLALAYSTGIFPWYSDETPILWYSPHQRFVLYPEKVKISKTMKKIFRTEEFKLTKNRAFEQVIKACAETKRSDQPGTWITPDMQHAFVELHKKGMAHSVEVWYNDDLAGGLYGVEAGNIFCGESMFSKKNNASKAALIWLCKNTSYTFIDCQFYTEHLKSMGAEYLSREEYIKKMWC
jgi:leucyl/phenylalanyl-tRNA--protein transferase